MRQSPCGRCDTIASSGAPSTGAITAIRLFRPPTAPSAWPWLRASAALGNDALDGGRHRGAEQVDEDDREHHPALGGGAPQQVGERRGQQPEHRQPPRAEAPEQAPEQQALHDRRDDADRRERPAVLQRPPAELEGRVQHPGGVEHELREPAAGDHRHQQARALQLRQPAQRADRIGGLPAKTRAGAPAAATRAARTSRTAG